MTCAFETAQIAQTSILVRYNNNKVYERYALKNVCYFMVNRLFVLKSN